jgi:hypothetical protein
MASLLPEKFKVSLGPADLSDVVPVTGFGMRGGSRGLFSPSA